VVPGAYADEYAADEPLRSVVAIRCTGIRVIVVITPVTDGGTIGYGSGHDFRADADTDGDLGIGCRDKGKSQNCCE
jgi:hypothetical protein